MFNILLFILTISLSISSYAAIIEYIPDDHSNDRYSVYDDDTVTDNITGLMWKRCSQGQTLDSNTCTNDVNAYDWQAALEQAESEDFATHSDWRLPNIKELRSIVAYNRYTPSINDSIFPDTPTGTFWSSSPHFSNDNDAWQFQFDVGRDGHDSRSNNHHVRLVRLGR